MQFSEFKEIVLGLFPDLTADQLAKYEAMEALYDEWNAKINVISRKDIGGLYPHHVLHSLAIADYLKTQRPDTYARWKDGGLEVLDLGTGGGFPGIPLAVLFPEVKFTLCDSVGKKTIVATEVMKGLGLKNVTVVNARAESLGKTFDFVVSRAVTSLDNFYPWVKGRFNDSILYLKGGDIAEETAVMMQRNHMAKGSVHTWPISSWLEGLDFTGKFVIDIRK
ncbi:MAG: 16S rRNA (guanine(527)-N(7))-methyltransferase RsmG [Bacteroidales bacterium]|nr:16S rRNA (guanine(527)-N(7))-methyltransferase RsmG [Bacteroidales bacterium]